MTQYVATSYWVNGYAEGDTDALGADTLHSHAADAATLTPRAVASPNDATHSHSADAPNVGPNISATVNSATHSHAADPSTVLATGNVTPAEARSLLGSGQPLMIADAPASVNEATHGHAADQPAMSYNASFTPNSAVHGHTADLCITLADSPAGTNEALHTHTADQPAMVPAAVASIDGATHSVTSDQVTMGWNAPVTVNEATHGVTSDQATLTPNVIQKVYPSEDIQGGAWQPSSGVDLYAMIDEPDTPDEGDYIFVTQTGSMAEFRINAGQIIGDDTSHQILMRYNGNGVNDFRLRLVQGITVISTWVETAPAASMQDYVYNVSPAEAANITDYNDLRVRVEALV